MTEQEIQIQIDNVNKEIGVLQAERANIEQAISRLEAEISAKGATPVSKAGFSWYLPAGIGAAALLFLFSGKKRR